MSARWRLLSPPPSGAGGALAVVAVEGDIDGALARLGARPVAVGEAKLRPLAGIDTGMVMRPSQRLALLTPHAGPAVVRRLTEALTAAGIEPASAEPDPVALHPEAASEIEARMLAALARAASPLAVDLLLDQPRRWAAAPADAEHDPAVLERSARLSRLIDPPTVVAVGPPNIGKSSLLNALAGRAVAIVADQPGTTRDHVGAAIDFGGLVVRYIDAPGLGGDGDEGEGVLLEAQRLATEAARRADLVLLCADAGTDFPRCPGPGPALRVALRSDLGLPRGPLDVAVSVLRGQGLADLVAAVRERLVPAVDLAHPGPWKFW